MQPATFQQFQQLAMHGNVIPVAQAIPADTLTPLAAFMKCCGEDDDGFLLESIEGGEKLARYSFIGARPRKQIFSRGGTVEVRSSAEVHSEKSDLFGFLQRLLGAYRFVRSPQLPRFCGGVVGCFGYDLVREIEELPVIHPPENGGIDAALGFYDTILAFDHLRQQIVIIANALLEEGGDIRAAYQEAAERISALRTRLQAPLSPTIVSGNGHASVHSNFSEEQFCAAVRAAQSFIRSGDIFQVVLSQRFSRPVAVPPLQIYRALRMINPSPYLYFLRQGGQSVVGSSPELLVRVENGEAVVRPLAGTRPRGATAEEDARLARELLQDEKELAEHAMLVDLGRNDIGRVARYGEVRLSERMAIERYSHVMHIVSEVHGRLRPEVGALDALRACFPAGTVSGAPKVRAMQIIEELEPTRRGIYAGALGYLDFSGNLDTCITIRTLVVKNGVAFFQAGAGIVADSVPEREYLETIHKSNALRMALALAEGGLELD